MTAEFKRSNRRLRFAGIYNVIVTSNSRLRAKLEGDADAWKRRLLIVRFETPRTGERIVDFHLFIIEREGAGILNFGIEGASELMADIQRLGLIQTSPEQQARVTKFIDESDSFRTFLRNYLVATSQTNFDVTVHEILERYYQHCVANDLNSLSSKDARKELEALMQELFGRSQSNSLERNGKSQRGYPKMRWRNQDDESYREGG
jgi:phage/plasmid-associated DNA primase